MTRVNVRILITGLSIALLANSHIALGQSQAPILSIADVKLRQSPAEVEANLRAQGFLIFKFNDPKEVGSGVIFEAHSNAKDGGKDTIVIRFTPLPTAPESYLVFRQTVYTDKSAPLRKDFLAAIKAKLGKALFTESWKDVERLYFELASEPKRKGLFGIVFNADHYRSCRPGTQFEVSARIEEKGPDSTIDFAPQLRKRTLVPDASALQKFDDAAKEVFYKSGEQMLSVGERKRFEENGYRAIEPRNWIAAPRCPAHLMVDANIADSELVTDTQMTLVDPTLLRTSAEAMFADNAQRAAETERLKQQQIEDTKDKRKPKL
jgi:hypothetical protein